MNDVIDAQLLNKFSNYRDKKQLWKQYGIDFMSITISVPKYIYILYKGKGSNVPIEEKFEFFIYEGILGYDNFIENYRNELKKEERFKSLVNEFILSKIEGEKIGIVFVPVTILIAEDSYDFLKKKSIENNCSVESFTGTVYYTGMTTKGDLLDELTNARNLELESLKMKINKGGIFINKENFMVENIISEDANEHDDDEINSMVVVETLGSENFEAMCQEYVDLGYLLSSTNSFVMPEQYGFQTKYIAIFALPEVLPGGFICEGEDDEGEEWKEGKKEH